MRMIFGCALMIGLAAVGSADDKTEKVDAMKLVGKWEPKEAQKGMVVLEFTKDGKFHASTGKKDRDADGTYTVDGNKIKVVLKFGDKEIKRDLIVTKLTDTELTLTPVDDDKKSESYTRLKDK
jgi:uncharacterized protein (TIGR03066 family)